MEPQPTPLCLPCAATGANDRAAAGAEEEEKGKENRSYEVDQFLLEAIENPRHRLTVLRMEMDIQRFMQNPDQQQFEFQHFQTSYLRCAAHRVTQHYGLQTLALDYYNTIDGLGSRIVAGKTPESKFPAICLSDIPTKQQQQLENYNKIEKLKLAIRPRQNKDSMVDSIQLDKRNTLRSVQQREEEYDKARARIFSVADNRSTPSSKCSNTSGRESHRTSIDSNEYFNTKDSASRVAIFRDREKDMIDPDYDRSYNRYLKGVTALAPSHNMNLGPCNVISHVGQLPGAQPLVSINPAFGAVGCNQTRVDTAASAVYMQWPAPAIIYAHSYDHLRRASFQAPDQVYQQPLSFDCWQNR